MKEGDAGPCDKNCRKECVVIDRNVLLASAEAMAEAFNQEWIIDLRAKVLKACEEMIPLLEGR